MKHYRKDDMIGICLVSWVLLLSCNNQKHKDECNLNENFVTSKELNEIRKDKARVNVD